MELAGLSIVIHMYFKTFFVPCQRANYLFVYIISEWWCSMENINSEANINFNRKPFSLHKSKGTSHFRPLFSFCMILKPISNVKHEQFIIIIKYSNVCAVDLIQGMRAKDEARIWCMDFWLNCKIWEIF